MSKPDLPLNEPDEKSPLPLYQWVAIIAYDGALFQGWQKQKHQMRASSIQAALEKAISFVANEPIQVFCAGRTDAGVHASGQVIHFTTQAKRSQHGWWMGINANLPKGISVEWIAAETQDFHARYQAYARRYFYVIDNVTIRPALQADQLTWWRHPLCAEKMHQAAQYLVGEHDFSAFRAQDCQAKSAVKHMHHVNVTRYGSFIVVDIKASAFLYHMVRNIMGVLIPIGQGKADIEWARRVLESKDRQQAGVTAPSEGLYFAKAYYPDQYDVAHQTFYPRFLSNILGATNEPS